MFQVHSSHHAQKLRAAQFLRSKIKDPDFPVVEIFEEQTESVESCRDDAPLLHGMARKFKKVGFHLKAAPIMSPSWAAAPKAASPSCMFVFQADVAHFHFRTDRCEVLAIKDALVKLFLTAI